MARPSMLDLARCGVTLTLVCAGLVTVTACNPTPSPCPPVPAAPSFYPAPAPRAPSTSMNLELSSDYMLATVKPAVESPNGQSGIHVRKVTLSEQGTGASAVNQITLTIIPWLRGAQGQQVEVSTRPFDLALNIVPYLVYPATVPDHATRLRILNNAADEGLALRFDFAGLHDDAFGTEVTCAASDQVSHPVLVGVLTQLGTQTPTVIAADTLAATASDLTKSRVHVTGVNIGSEGTLKLGFAFDSGAAAPFDPTPFVGHGAYAGTDWDWNLDINSSFFTSAIQSSAGTALTAAVPGATVTGVTAAFSSGGIDVNIAASATSVCGPFNFHVTTTAMPRVGADVGGHSVLQLPMTPSNFNPGTGQGFKAFCWAVEKTFFGGYSIATIKQSGSCGNLVGGPVELSTANGDVLYGAGVNTEYDFVILGRSKLLDQQLGVRTTVPPCTP